MKKHVWNTTEEEIGMSDIINETTKRPVDIQEKEDQKDVQDWDAFSLLYRAVKSAQQERMPSKQDAKEEETVFEPSCAKNTQTPPLPPLSPYEGFLISMVLHAASMIGMAVGFLSFSMDAATGNSRMRQRLILTFNEHMAGITGSMWIISILRYMEVFHHGGIMIIVSLCVKNNACKSLSKNGCINFR